MRGRSTDQRSTEVRLDDNGCLVLLQKPLALPPASDCSLDGRDCRGESTQPSGLSVLLACSPNLRQHSCDHS